MGYFSRWVGGAGQRASLLEQLRPGSAEEEPTRKAGRRASMEREAQEKALQGDKLNVL